MNLIINKSFLVLDMLGFGVQNPLDMKKYGEDALLHL